MLARTWVVTEQAEEGLHDAPRLLHGDLRVPHFRRGNHLHGLGDLTNVLDGTNAHLDCKSQTHTAARGQAKQLLA